MSEPCEKLELEFKNFGKMFDPFEAKERLKQQKAMWEECKSRANEMFKNMQKCYTNIAVLAGEDKRSILDSEVSLFIHCS